MERPRPLRPILVVEDDADSRIMLGMILTMQGYRTVAATNGAEALEIARAQQPCLILLDLMMPVMSGEDFRKAQLADARLKEIPVILLSARHDGAAKAHDLAVLGCIRKPVDFNEVLAQVATHCRPF